MNLSSILMFCVCTATGAGFGLWISGVAGALAAGVFVALGVACLLLPLKKEHFVARLGGFSWTRGQFCRGWLITGDTGSGKTTSGINQLLHQVFQNEPRWGGLCIDEKGVYWETLQKTAARYRRSEDLVLLAVGQQSPSPIRLNLIGDPSIPPNTYAKFVVDTATSMGQKGDKGFFKTQAQTHIGAAIHLLRVINHPVTLPQVQRLLTVDTELEDALGVLSSLSGHPDMEPLMNHFNGRYKSQPPEQRGGVLETIANYLHYFTTPEVAEVFCHPEGGFRFGKIDEGAIVCATMPQKFQIERRYVNAFLKLLFYTHVLRRFDQSKAARTRDNLLILWADEAQHFMTASEDGISDYNVVDVIREARATVVVATQSTTSFVPALGAERAKVLTLNLRNRMIFTAADEADALQSAEHLGRRRIVKRSWGYSGGKRTVNFQENEEFRVKPHVLRSLPAHRCVLVHCEHGHRRTTIPPLDADGRVADWFPRWRRWFG